MIGFEIMPQLSEIIKAATAGIHMVVILSFAALAVVITGAMMSATTAGRIPMNMLLSARLPLIVSGVRKIAMASMMINDGNMVPTAAEIPPFNPFSLSPIAVAMLTAVCPEVTAL